MTFSLLRAHLKISYRQMARKKLATAISLASLLAGMTAVVLIYSYRQHERSYDLFHKNYPNIYRVTTEWNMATTPDDKRATTVPWSGPGVAEAFEEVQAYTRLMPLTKMIGNSFVQYNNKVIAEENIFLVDPGFLTIFSFRLVQGDPVSALTSPRSVLISETIAQKYFGNENPLGKLLTLDTHGNLSGNEFKVTGILEDAPANAHFHYDFLLSYNSMWQDLNNGSTYWHWDNTYCYLLLHPETDVEAFQKKISTLRVATFGKEMGVYNDVINFKLQPLKDIHLFSSLKGELTLNGDGRYLNLLMLLGICILISAYINYLNLSNERLVSRGTEMGIRKVAGSSTSQLVLQLLAEALLIHCAAIPLALLMAEAARPLIENFTPLQWPGIQSQFSVMEYAALTSILLLTGMLLSAINATFAINMIHLTHILKGNTPAIRPGLINRNHLIVAQFILCLVLASATYIIHRQMKFIQTHDLGMDIDRVMIVKEHGFQPYINYERFSGQLSSSATIAAVGFSSAAPGDEILELGLRPKVTIDSLVSPQEFAMIMTDNGFFATLNIEFLAGRNFDSGASAEKQAILNEAAVMRLGYARAQDILGATLSGFDQGPLTVIGVVKNYNQRSLKNGYEPLLFLQGRTNNLGWNKHYYLVKLHAATPSHSLHAGIKAVEQAWHTVHPAHPLHYFFLNDYFNHQYQADHTFSDMFTLFAILSLFITYLGLLGLMATVTARRTKEIGIRKVLGASTQHIMILFAQDFVRWILLAALIALPITWAGAQRWLSTFAFRIQPGVDSYFGPLLVIFGIGLTIILAQAVKSALANPVDSIRYE